MRNKSRKRIMHELRIENERLKTSLRGCREELFECKQMYDIRETGGGITRIGEESFLNCVRYEANVKLALF